MTVHKFDTFAEYEEIVEKSKEKPVMVGFSRDGCQSCIDVAPIYEEVSNDFDIDFYKIHFSRDVSEELATKFENIRIQAFPTFILIAHGCEFHKSVQGSREGAREWFAYLKKALKTGS
ncbi:hypothetical protein B9J08_04858 [Candidozyma auris]|uniref:Thioredoxin domain-containing protein n=1 Tax=Candidozyma auris TaxID=498019 RepID=A0A2H0ZI00_CANAR|nr:hypothetical protein B9J08_004104 [[Candida] auris]